MPSKNNKRIAKNTIMLYFRMLFTMAVSLYTSRVVLNTLGVEDFGIYNVVGGIVIMFGFLNNAMAASTQRFLTFEMGKGDLNQINRVFSMSITIHSLIAIIVLILSETVGLWFLNTQLNIPVVRMIAANWVYQFSIFAFIITVLNVPYNAAIIAHERMNVYAYVSIIEVILKLAIVFMLVWFGFDKLKFYALLVFTVSLVIRIIYTLYCKRKFEECRYNFFWDKKLFQHMGSFASWNLLGVFAGIAYGQGVNILLNIFFGPVVNAARAIAFQVQGAVNGFVTNFQVAINPPITKSYSIGDKQYMYRLVFSASRYSFYLLLLLSMPVLIETKFILNLWLKTVPDYTIIFTRLALLDVLIYSLSGSLQTMVQATGKVKKYQLVVSGILLLNLPVSYFLLLSGFSPQSTFIVSIFISLIALIGRLVILKIIENFPVGSFFSAVLFRTIAVFFVAAIFPVFISTQISNSSKQFVLVLIFSILSVMASVYFLGITKSEKIFLGKNFLKLILKNNNK
jgi:O-antigen/teichoic acid export membrane protein